MNINWEVRRGEPDGKVTIEAATPFGTMVITPHSEVSPGGETYWSITGHPVKDAFGWTSVESAEDAKAKATEFFFEAIGKCVAYVKYEREAYNEGELRPQFIGRWRCVPLGMGDGTAILKSASMNTVLWEFSDYQVAQTIVAAHNESMDWALKLYGNHTQVLKGTGVISGDGWKDTTKVGQEVFVWAREMEKPYAPGQFQRVVSNHQCDWTASTEQYAFEPATVEEAQAHVKALTAQAYQAGVAEGIRVSTKMEPAGWFFRVSGSYEYTKERVEGSQQAFALPYYGTAATGG